MKRREEDYPKKHDEREMVIVEPYRFIDDDCIAKDCINGFIVVTDSDGYEKLYACPKCERWKRSVGKIAIYLGSLAIRSEQEMHARREQRKETYFNQRRSTVRIVRDAEIGQ